MCQLILKVVGRSQYLCDSSGGSESVSVCRVKYVCECVLCGVAVRVSACRRSAVPRPFARTLHDDEEEASGEKRFVRINNSFPITVSRQV